jgi:hypothetical protein
MGGTFIMELSGYDADIEAELAAERFDIVGNKME